MTHDAYTVQTHIWFFNRICLFPERRYEHLFEGCYKRRFGRRSSNTINYAKMMLKLYRKDTKNILKRYWKDAENDAKT